MNRAWHLRQDGRAFPVSVHIYCMDDEDLSSEAEAAAFLISTNSKDKSLAEYVLDAWMALLLEETLQYDADESVIEDEIKKALNSLPYHFQYPISDKDMISIHRKQGNYNDMDTLYEFADLVRDSLPNIQEKIKRSLNQQFCRVRYGGQYNSLAGNNEIWFRISSVGYNWVNTIYEFTSMVNKSYRLSHISICRDSESDETDKEYFYKAKDGTLYKHMPISEYFEEEHEHNPVFESIDLNKGILRTFRDLLNQKYTYEEAKKVLESSGASYSRDIWRYLRKRERLRYCIEQSKEYYRR